MGQMIRDAPTPEFMGRAALQLLSGDKSVAQLCHEKQHRTDDCTWKEHFLAADPFAFIAVSGRDLLRESLNQPVCARASVTDLALSRGSSCSASASE
jgi:hypothetical protein